MIIKRLVKGIAGATGGATAGGLTGALGEAMWGIQLGIPLGVLFGFISTVLGNGVAGFLSALISTAFTCMVLGACISPFSAWNRRRSCRQHLG